MALSDPELQRKIREEWDDFLGQIDLDKIPEHRFSPRFEREMRPVLARMRPSPLRGWKQLGRAAAILLVCGTMAFSGLMTVRAFREKTVHFSSTMFPTHVQIEIAADGYEAGEPEEMEFGWLPEGMEQVSQTENGSTVRTCWKNGQHTLMAVQRTLSEDRPLRIFLDTENAQTVQADIGGKTVTLILRDDRIQAIWVDSRHVMTLSADLPFRDMQKIIEHCKIRNP